MNAAPFCVPETNHAFKVYDGAAIMWLQFMVHVMVYSYDKRFVLLHQYFPQYVCSAQCGCFL
jgi:hypothetical protein